MIGTPVEEKRLVLPPNKPLERKFEFSKKPIIYDYLLFMDFNEKGNCILGSSNITGSFWEGSLLYFESPESLMNLDFSKYYIYMTASDGKFIKDDMIILAEDTGVLNVLHVDAKQQYIQPNNYFRHNKRIPQVAVWPNSSKVVSCSGRTLTVWDINSMAKQPVFISESVHISDVNSVDALKNEPNIFLSAASDRRACMWDTRSNECPKVIYTNEFSSLTQVAVNPSNSNYVTVGTQGGDVYLVDKREPNEFVSVSHCFDANINRIKFSDSNHFAVCGNSKEVLVFNCENQSLQQIYKNTDHHGHVKDTKWYNNKLFSCGFGDRELKYHKTI